MDAPHAGPPDPEAPLGSPARKLRTWSGWDNHAERKPRQYKRRSLEQEIVDNTTRLVETSPPYARAMIREYVDAKRAKGLTLGTCQGAAGTLRHFATHVPQSEWADPTPAIITSAILDYAQGRAETSVRTYVANVKAFLNWKYARALPALTSRALEFRRSRQEPRKRIPQAEFESLLEAAEEMRGQRLKAKANALLWLLWDSGMRVSEILALRRQDITKESEGGMTLILPKDAPRLKTGAREIYILESVPALEAWLAIQQPQSDTAPLFAMIREPMRPMRREHIYKLLERLAERAGLTGIHPHRFRHTRATRAAEAGWNEFEMNAYFGWIGGSKMAAHYVHMNAAHLRQRVRKEAQARHCAPHIAPSESIDEIVARLVQTLRQEIATALERE